MWHVPYVPVMEHCHLKCYGWITIVVVLAACAGKVVSALWTRVLPDVSDVLHWQVPHKNGIHISSSWHGMGEDREQIDDLFYRWLVKVLMQANLA